MGDLPYTVPQKTGHGKLGSMGIHPARILLAGWYRNRIEERRVLKGQSGKPKEVTSSVGVIPLGGSSHGDP